MGLSVRHIRFDGYRGYSRLELEELGSLVVLVGPNAVGKTNIIEGIQLLTAGESFRKPSWEEVVSWDADCAVIRATLEDPDAKRVVEHKMSAAGGKRSFEVNGKKKSASSLRGTCPLSLIHI